MQFKRLRSVKLLLGIIATLVVMIGWMIHQRISSVTNQMTGNAHQSLPAKLRQEKPFTVLVMGTDVGALGRGTAYSGNTDTMELIAVNPQKQQVAMLAIPRDTLVKVSTKRGADYVKINAAYAIGGANQAKKQVSELLRVPVDYYALVNMGAMKKVVNAVGGVNVDNPFAFDYEGHHFKKGRQHLNGNQALKYARMRYDDPNNDYGRQKRGQQVIQSAMQTFRKRGSLTTTNEILKATGDGVRTDLPVNNISGLYWKYHSSLKRTRHRVLRFKDAEIQGTAFQIATVTELRKGSNFIRRALGMESLSTIDNEETRLNHNQTTWNGYNQLQFSLPHGAKYNHPENDGE